MKKLAILGILCMIILVSITSGCTEEDNDENGGEQPPREPAPGFTLTSIDNETIKLEDYLGKIVILDFMYVACLYCDDEMGELKEVFSNYNSNEVVIMTIDIYEGDSVEDLIGFKEDYGDDWIYAFDTDNLKSKYQVSGVPKMVIIDKEGKIAFEHVGLTDYETLSSEIDELL